jgi:predicted dehydrogenase
VIQLGVIGCGDVAFRTYFPSIEELAGRAKVVAVFDVAPERANRAAERFGATAYTTLSDYLAHPGLEGTFNLTPAPFHRETTSAALDAGLHVLSEKPIAGTVEDAQALIAHAKARGKHLLVAPAVMASNRFRWLTDVLGNGRIGRLTVATGQYSTMGPAGWRQYTGDPGVFYSEHVGPVLDLGVYPLHGITGLMGPAKRVQAFGGIVIPERKVQIRRLAGSENIKVGANDVMMISLDFGGSYAQIFAGYSTPGSRVPLMEIHGTEGTMSLSVPRFYDAKGPVEFFFRDDSLLGVDGWMNDVRNPEQEGATELIGAGADHFVNVIEGKEEPILTAEHATHILEIMLKAKQSADEGRAFDLETTFVPPAPKPAG